MKKILFFLLLPTLLFAQANLRTHVFYDIAIREGIFYDVRTFGAVGDSSTDDATAIQATIDAAEADQGGVVYFPAGDFVVGTTLTVDDNNVSFAGASHSLSSLIRKSTLDDNMLEIGEVYGTNIYNLHFNGTCSSVDADRSLIAVKGGRWVNIHDCDFDSAGYASISLLSDSSAYRETKRVGISNNYFHNTNIGVQISGFFSVASRATYDKYVEGVIISDNIFTTTWTEGIDANLNVRRLDIIGNKFQDIYTAHTGTHMSEEVIDLSYVQDFVVANNVIDGDQEAYGGITLKQGAERGSVVGNTIFDLQVDTTGWGIMLANCNGVTVSGNSIDSCHTGIALMKNGPGSGNTVNFYNNVISNNTITNVRHGIRSVSTAYVDAGTHPVVRYFTVSDNTIRGSDAFTFDGISLVSPQYFTITGNTIDRFEGVGINLSSSQNDTYFTTIEGNDITYCLSGGIVTDGNNGSNNFSNYQINDNIVAYCGAEDYGINLKEILGGTFSGNHLAYNDSVGVIADSCKQLNITGNTFIGGSGQDDGLETNSECTLLNISDNLSNGHTVNYRLTHASGLVQNNHGYDGSEVTIATAAVTVYHEYHSVDTEGDAARDTLSTINGLEDSQFLILYSANSGRDVIIDESDNIVMMGSVDSLMTTNDRIMFHRTGDAWYQISKMK